jgi:drug/metabolite transporter (DMT)-like permease
VQALGPAVTAVFMTLQPLVGIVFATLLVGAAVSVAQGPGVTLVLVGVWLTTRG